MAILGNVLKYYLEVFALEGVLEGPLLLFGHQDIFLEPQFPLRELSRHDPGVEDYYRARDVKDLFLKKNVSEVMTLDVFDPRADIKHDMNLPIPEAHFERFASFMDIGSMEHVFDFRQCFENSLRMVRPGGTYFAHLPVRGYTSHGFHTPGPEAILAGLILNGFQITYLRITSSDGAPLRSWAQSTDVLLWVVARKTRSMGAFRIPQQDPETSAECERGLSGVAMR
jgi:hypothetical protein